MRMLERLFWWVLRVLSTALFTIVLTMAIYLFAGEMVDHLRVWFP